MSQGSPFQYTTFAPNKLYQVPNGDVCPIKTIQLQITVGAPVSVVAAVSGKKIRVVGGSVYSTGAYTDVNFTSGSGGTAKKIIACPANTVANPNMQIVNHMGDEFETDSGVALFATSSAVTANANVNYIEY